MIILTLLYKYHTFLINKVKLTQSKPLSNYFLRLVIFFYSQHLQFFWWNYWNKKGAWSISMNRRHFGVFYGLLIYWESDWFHLNRCKCQETWKFLWFSMIINLICGILGRFSFGGLSLWKTLKKTKQCFFPVICQPWVNLRSLVHSIFGSRHHSIKHLLSKNKRLFFSFFQFVLNFWKFIEFLPILQINQHSFSKYPTVDHSISEKSPLHVWKMRSSEQWIDF